MTHIQKRALTHIDAILASIKPYDAYVAAEKFLAGGELTKAATEHFLSEIQKICEDQSNKILHARSWIDALLKDPV